jgi:hypothetical protein
MSQHAAAKYCGVSKSALNDRIKGKVKIDAKPGGHTTLSADDEKVVVEWLKVCGKIGHPREPIHVRNKARKLALERGMDPEKAKKSFTQSWFADFMKRHPNISVRKTQPLEKCRAELTSDDLRPFYEVVQAEFEEHPILLEEP